MDLCGYLVFGLIVGLVARAILPGEQKMGLIRTALIGCGGSFVGGLIGKLLFGVPWSGFVGSVAGAMLLMLIFGASNRR
jgi:uncharacterized membrane protein YeaQ/YmgE (transglycosylase-associated protein family)